jgi:hypothetical protein
MLPFIMLSAMVPYSHATGNVYAEYHIFIVMLSAHYAEFHYSECHYALSQRVLVTPLAPVKRKRPKQDWDVTYKKKLKTH